MRIIYFTALFLLCFGLNSYSQVSLPAKAYRFTIDLNRVDNDRLKVDLITPAISQKSIVYYLPKMVPGTYAIYDFGRFVDQFKAFDKKGDTLKVIRNDVNSWQILNADKLNSISYLVNDSYDDTSKPAIFEPAGSDIENDSLFVINNHSFLGYFENMKNIPYELNIIHPKNLYGSTAMIDMDKDPAKDQFVADSYNQIVDNPLLYDVPDTTMIKVGNSVVLISVYSPHKKVRAEFLAKKLDTLLKAQTKYLGGNLPVEKYAFIVFLSDKPGVSGLQGALEHSYSSFYYYGELDSSQLSGFFVDNAAHEFFHIITPLSIHSNEIQNFDFNKPEMSQHLWLYEGTTEYHAHMVQEKYGMITPQQLLGAFSKMITASRARFNDTLSFTKMSKGVLDVYKEQYENVYQKGALIALCLDVELLRLSKGRYGLMSLIQDLSLQYGKKKGFEDDRLFGEIEKLTYPEIKVFLDTYVSGNQPLPLQKVFGSMGISYQPFVETKDSVFTMGRIGLGMNPTTQRLVVSDTAGMNAFGRALGYHKGDEIISINGVEMTRANMGSYLRSFQTNVKAGEEFVVRVNRKGPDGIDQAVDLKATMMKLPIVKYNVLTMSETATTEEIALRNEWLRPNGNQVQ